jgi:hypothetical protein
VNTNKLSKHYEKLTARERLPLIMAATRRGDLVERDRLVAAAPRVTYSAPDHLPIADAYLHLVKFSFLELVDLAADYLEQLAVVAHRPLDHDADQHLDLLLALGYRFQMKVAGWRRFCATNHFEAQAFWSRWPGWARLQRAETVAQAVPIPDEVLARFRELQSPDRDLLTEDQVAAAWQQCFEEMVKGKA